MLFLLLLIVWPIVELLVAIKVADLIGVGPMLLALIAGIPIGWWTMRSQGRGVMRRLAAALAERRTPAREVVDGALVLTGGFLVMVPGFISDAIGLLLLFPPSRVLGRRWILPRLRNRLVVQAVGFSAGRESSARQDYDVDSTALDVPPPKLPA
jgi:UPF0716 protein FxsA